MGIGVVQINNYKTECGSEIKMVRMKLGSNKEKDGTVI